MPAEEQVVRFTSVNGRRLAWGSAGSGPPLVFGGWWCSHLELDWRNASFRRFVDLFTDRFTVIRYDRPDTGLAGRDGMPATAIEDEVAALHAVVEEVGDRVSLFGGSSGGCVAAAYAAAYPERVDRLVLYGGYARGADIAEPEARASILAAVEHHWGVGSRLLADVFLPGGDEAERAAFVQFQRACATRESAAAALAAVYTMDIGDRLGSVTAPTLVVHRRADRAIPFRLGQDVAARIPGATLIALDGTDHFPWRGDAESVARAVLGFLGDDRRVGTRPAVLSDREVEVLRLVAQGMGDEEIARRLVLSVHTVTGMWRTSGAS